MLGINYRYSLTVIIYIIIKNVLLAACSAFQTQHRLFTREQKNNAHGISLDNLKCYKRETTH